MDRNIAAYCALTANVQRRSYNSVHVLHVITVFRIEHRSSVLTNSLHEHPAYAAGGWVWLYNTTPP